MKRLKKMLALLTAALFCVLPLAQPLTAQAEEKPITYYLKYIEEMKEWRYQQLTAWDEDEHNGSLDYVLHNLKDGDTIVIHGENQHISLELNVHLKNLTILKAEAVIITAKGIDEVYQHDGSCAINADVTNAYIHDKSVCNLNKNVTNLQILGTDDINAYVNVLGTVDHLKGADEDTDFYECYNIAKGTLRIEDGHLMTDAKDYSTTAPAVKPPAAKPPASGTASDEYDDVPKTGEAHTALWFMAIAAVCLIGSYRLRKN